MPLDPEDVKARLAALQFAKEVHDHHEHSSPHGCSNVVQLLLDDAERVYKWLAHGDESPTHLIIFSGVPYEQGSFPASEEMEESVSITLTDTQQVDLNVQPTDSKGYPTDDPNLQWSVDDENVVSIQQDPNDPKHITLVAGAPGSATVSVTDGTNNGAEAVVVTSGQAAALQLVAGTPTEQAPAGGAPSGGTGGTADPGTGTVTDPGTGTVTDPGNPGDPTGGTDVPTQ